MSGMDLDDRQIWVTTSKRVAEYLSILYNALSAEKLPEDLCNMVVFEQFRYISTPDPMEAMQNFFQQLHADDDDDNDDD